jgi:ribosomal protein S14
MSSRKPLCAVPSCDRPRATGEYCAAHHLRLVTVGDVRADQPIRKRRTGKQATHCRVCGRTPVVFQSLCAAHRYRLKNLGSVFAEYSIGDPALRKASR